MTSPQTVGSVRKALSILELIAGSPEPLTVKELIHSLNLPPASCYRIVRTLLAADTLWQDAAGGLRIGFGLAKLARAYTGVEREIQPLQPDLQRLAARLRLAAKISGREGNWAVTLLRAEPSVSNAISNPVGARFHLAQGSAATALLAALPLPEVRRILASAPEELWRRQSPEEVLRKVRAFRRNGVARDFGVQHPSIYAMSMRLRLGSGQGVAVSVVGWPEDFQGKRESEILKVLRETVDRMGRRGEAGSGGLMP